MRSLTTSVLLAALVAVFAATPASAHAVGAEEGGTSLALVLGTAGLVVGAYGMGFLRLRRREGGDIAGLRALAPFVAAILLGTAVVIGPFDELSDQLFAAHMIQHLVLILAVAPLLVWGRTGTMVLWALPRRLRRWGASPPFRAVHAWLIGPFITSPVAIWIWFCGAFVFWHLPGPYDWALHDVWVHGLEHMAFLVTAYGFWSVVIQPLGRRRLDHGAGVLFVATAAIVSGLPGALMILAARPLYPAHADGVAAWGLTLVQDQQLGGLIMWIPAGFAYLLAISALLLLWLRDAERRSERRKAGLARGAAPLLALLPLLLLAACEEPMAKTQAATAIGDPAQGARLIAEVGCGSCHQIPGIEGASALVGPPLDHMSRRVFIAGLLRNTPDNMVHWLRFPQSVVPGNAMPDMDLGEEQARDIAAYLYTLE